MATDYKRIAKENTKKYGTAIDEYGPLLLADRYTDRTHFVYELLQNAEDAIGWRGSEKSRSAKTVSFELHSDRLIFRHFGLPFTEEHVRGICHIGKGTKAADLTSIGKLGIGFKSVYAYTHHPEVHSGQEHFLIDLFVRPRETTVKPTSDGETLFVLPFDHPEVNKETAHDEIADRLGDLGLKTLLFLRNIECVNYETDFGRKGQYSRKARQMLGGFERVTLRGAKDEEVETVEEWLVCRKPVSYEGQPAGFVEIAFSLEQGGAKSPIRTVQLSESPLVVFFPTEKETHFGFLIQGPYRTTPSRDNVPTNDLWNQQIVRLTATLLIETLRRMRDANLLNVRVLETLVVDPAKYKFPSQAWMFRPICEALLTAFQIESLLPSFRGGYAAGTESRLATTEGLRSLLSSRQLRTIVGEKDKVTWLVEDITRDQTPTLRAFLVDSVGVEELSTNDFLRMADDPFLSEQSDAWTTRFYQFLAGQPATRSQSWFLEKAVIRLQDGTHVRPFDGDNRPNAYLPGHSSTEFPTVRRQICRNRDAMRFLRAIGLREPDPIDDVLYNILPRYQEPSYKVLPQYTKHVQRIVSAFATDSTSQREKLLAQLRVACWIPCQNAATKELVLGAADNDIYFATPELQRLFGGNPDVWFVDCTHGPLRRKDGRTLLLSCGVCQILTRNPIPCTLTEEDLRRMRVQEGLENFTKDEAQDYEIIGLAGVLERLGVANLRERRSVSRLLWDCLNQAVREHGQAFLYGHYRWWYSHQSRTTQFPARFIRLLRESSWLLTSRGDLTAPRQICFEDLPSSFRSNANALLVELLEFKSTEIKQISASLGIDEEVLALIRDEGITAEQLRQLLDKVKRIEADRDESVREDGGEANGGFVAPDEVSGVSTYVEGATKRVTVNYYERNSEARSACIAYHGCRCVICGMDFGKKYGNIGEGYIHVHHLRDLASLGKEYAVKPVEDLRPVCPNCHAMLHASKPAMDIDRLRVIISMQRKLLVIDECLGRTVILEEG